MPFPSPKLDDRNWDQLVAGAREVIERKCPGWSDLSPSDPGIILLEAFAYITDAMIYRLNQLPDKAYLSFLQLMGVKLQPPAGATATLRFQLGSAMDTPVKIPSGTRVTVSGGAATGERPVFVTTKDITIPAGSTEETVLAQHCELVEGELAGIGTGRPGQTVTARLAPIIAPIGDGLDLVVGVQTPHRELAEGENARQLDGKAYRVWHEVDSFAEVGNSPFAYIADRSTGTIAFAPSAYLKLKDAKAKDQTIKDDAKDDGEALHTQPTILAAVPPADAQIRLWYRRGGGSAGNVAAKSLTTLKDPIGGVKLSVENPSSANGGRAGETVENAMVRGPIEFHMLQRAVTATDFELLARRAGGVARAKAFTKAMEWVHASPGTVEVLLVPYIENATKSARDLTVDRLKEHQTDVVRDQIQRQLDERRPLGTTCIVEWARYKSVTVKVRVVVYREENPTAVRDRVVDRLYQVINPLPTDLQASGWRFGQPLRPSDIFSIVLSEPGVSYADNVRLVVDEVPGSDVRWLTADQFQPHTWYAAAGDTLFRSLDDGDGWDPAKRVPDEQIESVAVHPNRPGLVAFVSRGKADDSESHLYVSRDCGENWTLVAQLAFRINGVVWSMREHVPVLLLATDVGLYQLAIEKDATPIQVIVDPAKKDQGFYALAVATDATGNLRVAVAAQNLRGIFLSDAGGRSETFRNVGLEGKNVRVLAMQSDRVRLFLWAGISTPGFDAVGEGCYNLDLTPPLTPGAGDWRAFNKNWSGGSVNAIAFQGSTVQAATWRGGVLSLDPRPQEPSWVARELSSGLPDDGKILEVVSAVAAGPDGEVLLAGGPKGVYRSLNNGDKYEAVSSAEFTDKVTLPSAWLFCSGRHEIEVVREDETSRD